MSEAVGRESSITALETQLANTSRATDPFGWAIASYRLGLARAESPIGRPEDNLRSALELYDAAAGVLTERGAPIEHARVLNAAASAHRLLGDPRRAAELFERASRVLEGRGGDAEWAGVLSNLGLALTDCGETAPAVEAFERALELLAGDDAEQRRARVAARHNLAQTLMSTGHHDDLASAVEVLEQAAAECVDEVSPLHKAMVAHSLGVARKGQAEIDVEARRERLEQAIRHFDESLEIFTASSFPFHHAVAKQNLGLALAGRGDTDSLRRALSCYEDAVATFDPRLHPTHWRATYENMEALEARLRVVAADQSRHDHFATLLGDMDATERLGVVRERFARFERLPPRQQVDRLCELTDAIVRQPPRSFVATLRTIIAVLMELPDDLLRSALEAQLIAHSRLGPHERRAADFVLDEAINALLFGPQRIRVRDLLVEIGWERP